MVKVLGNAGYSAEVVETGRQALEALEARPFSLVLMDLEMPEMDGFEAVRLIRGNPSERVAATPVIAMTAHALDEDKQRCLAAGMNDYISKPIEVQRVIEVVETWSNPDRSPVGDAGNARTS